jgi:hypothetical protein
MLSLTLQIHIARDRRTCSMPNADRIRRLAAQLQKMSRQADQDREIQLHRAKVLNSRAPHFWKGFVQELVESVDLLNQASECSPTAELHLSLSPDHNSLELSKLEYPYIRAGLQLDVDGGCIKGEFRRAPERPTQAQLKETPILIDLQADNGNQIYAALDGVRIEGAAELAADIIEWVVTGRYPAR